AGGEMLDGEAPLLGVQAEARHQRLGGGDLRLRDAAIRLRQRPREGEQRLDEGVPDRRLAQACHRAVVDVPEQEADEEAGPAVYEHEAKGDADDLADHRGSAPKAGSAAGREPWSKCRVQVKAISARVAGGGDSSNSRRAPAAALQSRFS